MLNSRKQDVLSDPSLFLVANQRDAQGASRGISGGSAAEHIVVKGSNSSIERKFLQWVRMTFVITGPLSSYSFVAAKQDVGRTPQPVPPGPPALGRRVGPRYWMFAILGPCVPTALCWVSARTRQSHTSPPRFFISL